MNQRQSTFVKKSDAAFGKDTYYRFIKNSRNNWRKLLLVSASALIGKLNLLEKNGDHRLFIIDDTVEAKGGKHIECCCRYICSNKEQ